MKVESTVPQKDLYRYRGRLTVSGPNDFTDQASLGIDQFLHRGAFIKNTSHLHALVIHTGVDSKLIMNLGKYTAKLSNVEVYINKALTINAATLIIIAGISCGLSYTFNSKNYEGHTYMFENGPSAG